MNPILILTHDNLELTKRAVCSAQHQDVPTTIFVIDNGSTDGTREWLQTQEFNWWCRDTNEGVSKGWNLGFRWILKDRDCQHLLCCGNDVWLAPWTYSSLLKCEVPFVTAVAVGSMEQIPEFPDILPLTPNPDFSCFLTRREAWEKLGAFDEEMALYCQDCDWHIKGHRMGLPMWKASIPYFHTPSSTVRNARPEEREVLQSQARRDREAFQTRYGCLPGTKDYEAIFKT